LADIEKEVLAARGITRPELAANAETAPAEPAPRAKKGEAASGERARPRA